MFAIYLKIVMNGKCKKMKKINKLKYWKERWENNDKRGKELFKRANNIGDMLDKKQLKKTSDFFSDMEEQSQDDCDKAIILMILKDYSRAYNETGNEK